VVWARKPCSASGVDAGCNCGAAVVSKSQRIAKYDKANPGKSTRQVAEKLGDVSHMAVNRARQTSGATSVTPEDDRPTIDKPPRGELRDDQGSSAARGAHLAEGDFFGSLAYWVPR
jgi:hypothetical protein